MENDIADIRKASREIVRGFGLLESKCATIDISYAEGHALLEINKYTVLTAGELARILSLNRSSTARTILRLKKKGWVSDVLCPDDSKKKPVTLTEKGRKKVSEIDDYSDSIVKRALRYLEEDKRQSALTGMRDFAKALKMSRVLDRYTIRLIQKKDNRAIKQIIKRVCREFHTDGEGGPAKDKALNNMFQAYSRPGSAYFIVTDENKVIGGAGIGPLKSAEITMCEFQKMYLLPQARGQGLGEVLIKKCIQKASDLGYKKIYIETVSRMVQAVNLYKRFGAKTITTSPGETGHHQCEVRLIIEV